MAIENTQSRPMSQRPAKISVRFDQQQRRLVDFLREEGKFGTEDGEIIGNVVRDYLRQQKERTQERPKNPTKKRGRR